MPLQTTYSNKIVERFNSTFKTMLREHATKFELKGNQYLSGVLWVHRNTLHSSTGEKHSYLLYRFDCYSPTEAALQPLKITTIENRCTKVNMINNINSWFRPYFNWIVLYLLLLDIKHITISTKETIVSLDSF